jgi:hypothetical protein
MSDLYRYFESGKDEGITQERERIIKLLEDYIPDPHTKDEECEDCSLIRDLIALIKSEPRP